MRLLRLPIAGTLALAGARVWRAVLRVACCCPLPRLLVLPWLLPWRLHVVWRWGRLERNQLLVRCCCVS
jgi:hypothetical protein